MPGAGRLRQAMSSVSACACPANAAELHDAAVSRPIIRGTAPATKAGPQFGMTMTEAIASNDSLAKWRANYEARLRQDWGWLSVTGLHWLDDGEHSLGSAESAVIRLEPGDAGTGSAVPGLVATVNRQGSRVSLHIQAPGAVLKAGLPAESGPLRFDGTQGERFVVGNQSFLVVRRSDRVGVRTWNNDSAQRRQYRGSDWFEPDGNWRVEAEFRPFGEPRTVH